MYRLGHPGPRSIRAFARWVEFGGQDGPGFEYEWRGRGRGRRRGGRGGGRGGKNVYIYL